MLENSHSDNYHGSVSTRSTWHTPLPDFFPSLSPATSLPPFVLSYMPLHVHSHLHHTDRVPHRMLAWGYIWDLSWGRIWQCQRQFPPSRMRQSRVRRLIVARRQSFLLMQWQLLPWVRSGLESSFEYCLRRLSLSSSSWSKLPMVNV